MSSAWVTMMKHVVIVAAVSGVLALGVAGQDSKPAADVVQPPASTAPAEESAAAPSAEQIIFANDLKAFRTSSAKLEPDRAAAEWLKLLDRAVALPAADDEDEAIPPLDHVLESLPPPAAWEALAKAIDARPKPQGPKASREIGLRLLGHVLAGDEAAQQADLAALDALVADGNAAGVDQNDARALANIVLGRRPEPQFAVAQLEEQLRTAAPEDEVFVPDLVTLVGPAKAEALLRKALVSPVTLHIDFGDETAALARKLAVELVDEMAVPQWGLVDVNSVALYEALEHRFVTVPATQPKKRAGFLTRLFGGGEDARDAFELERSEAQQYYLLGLIAAGRSADAIKLAKEMGEEELYLPFDGLEVLDRAGGTKQAYGVLHALLVENPELPVWSDYYDLATKLGKIDEMLALARQSAAREGIDPPQSRAIRYQLQRALFAADHVDEGVKVLRQFLAEKIGDPDEEIDYRPELALTLATIGAVLKNDAWRNEGLKRALEHINATPADDYNAGDNAARAAGLLMDAGRGPEAVELLTDIIARRRQTDEAGEAAGNPDSTYEYHNVRKPLIELLSLYHRAGRQADVVALLDTVPYWKAKDLAEIYTESDAGGTPLAHLAASSLAEVGRADEARKIVDALLDANGGFDPAYELVIKLAEGDDVIPRLDELFRRDPLEERPLIWKAELLRRAKKLDEAENLARQAIAIDPSDGEQPAGRRMRAYGVLSDILREKGDAKESDRYSEAVKAIRIAEQADVLLNEGLIKRGVEMHKQALERFQDAYSIHSRLAVRLAELGMHKEAEDHYRKAFELMPDSFGRAGSHLLDWEQVFRGVRAQGIAEEVFNTLLKTQPDRPQVQYLLGCLRKEQGRAEAALPLFRSAVKLDPNFVGAWMQIQDLGDSMHLPARERDEAILNMLRLDPQQRHATARVYYCRDLSALWGGVENALKQHVPKPASLYSLPAGAAELAKAKPAEPLGFEGLVRYEPDEDENVLESPGKAVASTELMMSIAPLIAGGD